MLQGESFGDDLLTQLIQAQPLIEPFVSPSSLTELVNALSGLADADMRAAAQPGAVEPAQAGARRNYLHCLSTVEASMVTIQEWFDDNSSQTFADILKSLEAMLGQGMVVFMPSSSTSALYMSVNYPLSREKSSGGPPEVLPKTMKEEELNVRQRHPVLFAVLTCLLLLSFDYRRVPVCSRMCRSLLAP